MIIVIAGTFPTYDKWGINGEEFVASHGIAEDGTTVILQNVHPRQLGAVMNLEIGEWVIYSPEEKLCKSKKLA